MSIRKLTIIALAFFLIILIGIVAYFTSTNKPLEYRNAQYGFSFALPSSWKGYTIANGSWEGFPIDAVATQTGSISQKDTAPLTRIRPPLWTVQKPRHDLPIIVFTPAQWDLIQQEKLSVSAAPIGPSELGRNSGYVFALPARYNFAFPEGFEEVNTIIQSKPLRAF